MTRLADLPGLDERAAELWKNGGSEDILQFMDAYESGGTEKIEGLTKAEIDAVYALIKENVEFVEEEGDEEQPSSAAEQSASLEEKYYCPECGAEITLDMTQCPKCGVEFEFTEDEE